MTNIDDTSLFVLSPKRNYLVLCEDDSGNQKDFDFVCYETKEAACAVLLYNLGQRRGQEILAEL